MPIDDATLARAIEAFVKAAEEHADNGPIGSGLFVYDYGGGEWAFDGSFRLDLALRAAFEAVAEPATTSSSTPPA